MRSHAPYVLVAFLVVVPLTVAIAALGLSCKSMETGAREEFSRKHYCPLDRVEARRRADLRAWDVAFSGSPEASPPDEVAKDPERLGMWKQEQAQHQKDWSDGLDVYEVRGCGHEELSICHHPGGPEGGIYLSEVSCSEGRYPAGTQKSW
jgi:hypothetical protein